VIPELISHKSVAELVERNANNQRDEVGDLLDQEPAEPARAVELQDAHLVQEQEGQDSQPYPLDGRDPTARFSRPRWDLLGAHGVAILPWELETKGRKAA
jgi:hypothetical protein